jgi:hypothetical protein
MLNQMPTQVNTSTSLTYDGVVQWWISLRSNCKRFYKFMFFKGLIEPETISAKETYSLLGYNAMQSHWSTYVSEAVHASAM